MKTVKLTVGIISLTISLVVVLQSCAVGVANVLSESDEFGGMAGGLLAICLIVSGILAIVGRNSNGGTVIVAGVINLFGGIIACMAAGDYLDLNIWGGLAVIFGIIYLVPTIIRRRKEKQKQRKGE